MKDNNLKDTENYGSPIIKDTSFPIGYTKTHKLITALYMVTDIIDINEPIRNKLRTLGTEIISDIYSMSRFDLDNKIKETVSFLDIASAVNIISSMNCSILKKEFLEFKQSINDSMKDLTLSVEFFGNSPLEGWPKAGVDKFIPSSPKGYSSRGELNSKGHTTIGLQKGSTLLKALSDKTLVRSLGGLVMSNSNKINNNNNFDILKKQRREEIIKIIKNIDTNEVGKKEVSIKDIVLALRSLGVERGEKTIQRELISMVKDGVLNKTGEKRWTQYSL